MRPEANAAKRKRFGLFSVWVVDLELLAALAPRQRLWLICDALREVYGLLLVAELRKTVPVRKVAAHLQMEQGLGRPLQALVLWRLVCSLGKASRVQQLRSVFAQAETLEVPEPLLLRRLTVYWILCGTAEDPAPSRMHAQLASRVFASQRLDEQIPASSVALVSSFELQGLRLCFQQVQVALGVIKALLSEIPVDSRPARLKAV